METKNKKTMGECHSPIPSVMTRHLQAALFLLILCLLTTTSARAAGGKKQGDSIQIYTHVMDAFTHKKVMAEVTLMRADSSVMSMDSVKVYGDDESKYVYYVGWVPRADTTYILRATAQGYHDTTMTVTLRHTRRKSYENIPDILMRRKPESADKNVDLDDVVVQGTRVKVVYKNDTIIYDASAFKLPEGSMLDALVAQLPGAEMDEDGNIKINGRQIDFLTLNGKDFFKGDNKKMLENLPYFIVKSIKVYEKDTEKSQMIGRTVEQKDYVMDVLLKREYSRGYMANVTAGGGTDNRWMAKAFGSYFTDNVRLALFTNQNNVNEDRSPGRNGDWSTNKIDRGVQTTRLVGLNLNYDDGKNNLRNDFSGSVEWDKARNESRTYSETFSDNATIYSGANALDRSRAFTFRGYNSLWWKKQRMRFTLQAKVDHNKTLSTSADSTYSTTLTNSTQTYAKQRSTTLNSWAYLDKYLYFSNGDYMTFNLKAYYYNDRPSENFNNQQTWYASTNTVSPRYNYNDNRQKDFRWASRVNYSLALPKEWEVEAGAGYEQEHWHTRGALYRLDSLENAPFDQPGWLPAGGQEVLDGGFDADNSSNQNTTKRSFLGSLEIMRYSQNLSFEANLEYRRTNEHMHYTHAQLDTLARRSYNKLDANVLFRYKTKRYELSLDYNGNTSIRDYSGLMPIVNTSNPLSTYIANPDLDNEFNHSLNTGVTLKNDSIGSRVYFKYNVAAKVNTVGTRRLYDSYTGAYTTTRDNVRGNWNCSLSMGWNRPWGSQKLWNMSLSGGVDYSRSIDFLTLTYDSSAGETATIWDTPLSKVHDIRLNASAVLSYRKGDFSAEARGKLMSRHTRSHNDEVQTVDANEFSYGWNATYTVPVLKVTLATDVTMYSRRGYETDIMNTDELVWNASISRSIMKGKMTFKLLAYDILGELSTTRYSVNSQGRTERWYNSIPRYAMLTVTYKITQKPKK